MRTAGRVLLLVASCLAASAAQAQDFSILVTSVNERAVVRFDQNGSFLNYFIYPGSGNLSVPLEMTFGPDGRAYISNRDGDRINYYTPEGGFIGTFAIGSGLDNPHGLEFGPDGHLYVAGEVSGAILKFDGATSAFLGHFAAGLDIPVDLEFAPNGDLIVADRTTIRRYDAAGNLLQTLPFSEARGITLGPDGALYVSDVQHARVIRYAAFDAATASVFVGPNPALNGGLSGPYGLRFGPDQHLYVASSNTNLVIKYDGTTGAFLGSIAVSHPIYVTFGAAAGSTLSPQVAALQQQVAELLAENASLRSQLDQLAPCLAESASLREQVNTLQLENQLLRSMVTERDATIAAQQQRIAALEQQLQNAGDTTPLNAMIASLTKHLFTRKADANVAEAARAYARAAIDAANPRHKKAVAIAERHYRDGVRATTKGHFTTAVRQFRLAYAAVKL